MTETTSRPSNLTKSRPNPIRIGLRLTIPVHTAGAAYPRHASAAGSVAKIQQPRLTAIFGITVGVTQPGVPVAR